MTDNADPAVRFWQALRITGVAELRRAAQDASPDVRLAAADGLGRAGEIDAAIAIIRDALRHESVLVRLAALNAADRLGRAAAPLLPDIRAAKLSDPRHKDVSDYVGRMVQYLPARLAP